VEGYLLSDRDLRAMVLIIDIRRDPQDEEHNLLAWLEQRDVPPVVIITKADKLSRGKRPVRAEVFRRELGLISPPLLFSALTGEGRAEIWECLLERSGIH